MTRHVPLPRLAVPYHDGRPVVLPDGLRYELITDGDYRLERFHVVESDAWNVRYHRIVTSDPSDLHDHPWDYVTTLLSGAYIEHTADGAELFRAPCTLTRSAEDAHRLELPDGPVWTLLVTGPVRRRWGFHTEAGWVPWHKHGQREPAPSRTW